MNNIITALVALVLSAVGSLAAILIVNYFERYRSLKKLKREGCSQHVICVEPAEFPSLPAPAHLPV
jgi:hypothetical protein